MTPEIRTKLLELAKPTVSNPDIIAWIARAKELEAYVNGGGQSQDPPKATTMSLPQARTHSQSQSPAHRK
jgi:hypothetical protein